MKPLFSELGTQLIESFAWTNPIYAFDFDGTLAPIMRSPEQVKVSKKIFQSLESLSQQATVAIISGRSIRDLRTLIAIENITLIGNHGLEGLHSSPETLKRCLEICASWKRQLSSLLKEEWASQGVFTEDKTYSLAVHYRLSRRKKETRVNLITQIAQLNPSPRVILGKSVINLIPPGAPHKGVALLELMMKTHKKTAIYVGDDDTDEDVFSLPEEGLLTVRVGKKKNSAAQFFIEKQSDIIRILDFSNKVRDGL